MSGPLLLGIAAVGVGWAWIHRAHPAPAVTVSADPSKTAADTETVGEQLPPLTGDPTSGVAAVTVAIDKESHAPGPTDIPVQGSDGGQVISAGFAGPDGQSIMVIDPMASTGGADPSTQQTGAHNNRTNDANPLLMQGDTSQAILAAKYGVCGADGLTRSQISVAYRDSAVWSNEVF